MTATLLELSHVTVKRSGGVILDCPHWKMSEREFVGLIGPNGAGKSTFLQCASGLIHPQRGRVTFREKSLAGFFSRSRWRQGIAYIPQTMYYNTDIPFTVREVVSMSRKGSEIPSRWKSSQSIVDYWLERMGLIDRAEQIFRSLSGGQQQKALLARAMAGEPRLLLLDEPGANLDIRWKKQLSEILEELFWHASISVIMVSHDFDLLPACCERVTLLHEGRILSNGNAAEVLNGMDVKHAYSEEETL